MKKKMTSIIALMVLMALSGFSSLQEEWTLLASTSVCVPQTETTWTSSGL